MTMRRRLMMTRVKARVRVRLKGGIIVRMKGR